MSCRRVATAVSLALSPYTYGGFAALIIWLRAGAGDLEAAASLALSVTVLPLVPIFFDARRGRTDIFVSAREARLRYYLLTLFSYAAGALHAVARGWAEYFPIYASYALTAACLTAVNELAKWKVSAHAAGVAGPTTLLTLLASGEYAALYLLLAPVAWARLELKAHTPSQLAAGAALAVSATLAALGPASLAQLAS